MTTASVGASSVEPGPLAPSGPATARPLRILLAIPLYPPVIGGAEVHVSRLAAALSRRGHDVHVLTSWKPPMPEARHWRDPGGTAVTSTGRRLPASQRERAYVAEVAAHVALRWPKYDVVQLFLPGLHMVAGLGAARLRGTASAIMFGGSGELPYLRTLRLGRLQLAAIRRWADAVVVLNSEMQRDFSGLGIPPSQIAWLPCSVDTAVFRPPTLAERAARRKALQLADDAFVVAFVGRLIPVKNLPALVRGVGTFARGNRRAVLCLVGDGAVRASLEEIAAEAPSGSIRFLGERAGDDIAHILQAADVFAMVSHSEGIPCALIEAMATGLPCIVHDIPALAQLVSDGEEGVRILIDDAEALQRALGTLERDPELRRRMGLAGRKRAQAGYGVDFVARQHEELYDRAMARRGTAVGVRE